jgi:two-component system, OmpR family, osmolarity sensor histidine kinase EnvZ
MSFELRRFLPRSLYGRAALILIVPIVTIQLVVSIVFIQRHFERVTQQMTGNIALEVEYMLRQVNAAPDLAAAQQVVAGLVAPLALRVELPSNRALSDTRDFVDLTGAFVIEALYQSLGAAAATAGQP